MDALLVEVGYNPNVEEIVAGGVTGDMMKNLVANPSFSGILGTMTRAGQHLPEEERAKIRQQAISPAEKKEKEAEERIMNMSKGELDAHIAEIETRRRRQIYKTQPEGSTEGLEQWTSGSPETSMKPVAAGRRRGPRVED